MNEEPIVAPQLRRTKALRVCGLMNSERPAKARYRTRAARRSHRAATTSALAPEGAHQIWPVQLPKCGYHRRSVHSARCPASAQKDAVNNCGRVITRGHAGPTSCRQHAASQSGWSDASRVMSSVQVRVVVMSHVSLCFASFSRLSSHRSLASDAASAARCPPQRALGGPRA